MKKALEAELISLAHKVLQLKGEKDIGDLKYMARELYEKLSVLDFAQKHFDGPQPTIGKKDISKILEEIDAPESGEKEVTHDKTAEAASDQSPRVAKTENESPATSEQTTAVREESQEKPEATGQADDSEKTPTPTKTKVENSGIHYDDLPQFEPVAKTDKPVNDDKAEARDHTESKTEPADSEEEEPSVEEQDAAKDSDSAPDQDEKPTADPAPNLFSSEEKSKTKNDPDRHQFSLNERFKKGIQIGLNDRLAFIKHLFEGSASDYNRVLSQLNTIESFEAAKSFIRERVKPDYDWSDKEEYENRFLETLENRFD